MVVGALLGGCAHAPREVAVIYNGGECPRWSDTELAQTVKGLSQASDTLDLQCALERLRANPAPFEETDAGARICFLLADRTVQDQARREKLAAEGVEWAEQAISAGAGQDGAVHYYLAVNLGISVRNHVSHAIKTLPRVVSELEKANELSPEVDGGGPMRVLGMAYLMAPPWPTGIGDADKALEYLSQAVASHPEHPLNHIFYAQALWNVDQYAAEEDVRGQLSASCELIGKGGWGSAARRWRAEIAQLSNDSGFAVRACTALDDAKVGAR